MESFITTLVKASPHGDTVGMGELTEKLAGKFIVIDGPDGAGKSTQLDMLTGRLESSGVSVQRAVDPGGTDTGQKIREILLHRKDLSLSPMCETLLFTASRAQLVAEVIRPAIDAGRTVLCDRFISATIAYQGALGVDRDLVLRLGRIAVEDTFPNLTIILDLPVEEGMKRLGEKRDRMESRGTEYHRNVRRMFRELGDCYPAPVECVDATGTSDEVAAKVRDALQRHFVHD